MHETATSTTWRAHLGEIIREKDEREQLAARIGVNPATLVRWSTNATNPRLNEIRALLRAVPEQLLREQLEADILGLSGDVALPAGGLDQDAEEARDLVIPERFYANTLRVPRDAAERFWTVCNLILRQMLDQLDPTMAGLEVVVAQCMPPRTGKVRSLLESVGQGTPPWTDSYPQEKNSFLGAESLAGHAVAHGHWAATTRSSPQTKFLPYKAGPYEESAAAFPIVLDGKIGGCLIVSSTARDFFTWDRLQLIDDYADLCRLAFCDDDFYPPSSIELGIMPDWEVQSRAFSTLPQRVKALLREAHLADQVLDALTAVQMVRQQLEGEFLHPPLEKEASRA